MPHGDVSAVRCVPGGWRPVLRGLRRPFGAVPVACEPVTPGKPFCRSYGHQLSELAPPSSAATPASAAAAADGWTGRRWRSGGCARCFWRSGGFTALSESRDPEAVRELLSHYFDRA